MNPQAHIGAIAMCRDGTDTPSTIRTRRSMIIDNFGWVCLIYWLREEVEAARSWASQLLDAADDYFWGDWRIDLPAGNYSDQPPDLAWHRRHMTWKSELEESLIWGSCIGAWDRIATIAAYPQDDVKLGVEQSRENRAWLLILAGHLSGRPWSELAPHVEVVRAGRKATEKLLLDLLEAILAGDDARIAGASDAYFAHFRKGVNSRDLYRKVAREVSILRNLGDRLRHPVPVPPKLVDRVPRLL
jgi:hypothetical protein